MGCVFLPAVSIIKLPPSLRIAQPPHHTPSASPVGGAGSAVQLCCRARTGSAMKHVPARCRSVPLVLSCYNVIVQQALAAMPPAANLTRPKQRAVQAAAEASTPYPETASLRPVCLVSPLIGSTLPNSRAPKTLLRKEDQWPAVTRRLSATWKVRPGDSQDEESGPGGRGWERKG